MASPEREVFHDMQREKRQGGFWPNIIIWKLKTNAIVNEQIEKVSMKSESLFVEKCMFVNLYMYIITCIYYMNWFIFFCNASILFLIYM